MSDNLPVEQPDDRPDSLVVGMMAAFQMAATGLGYIDPAVAVLVSGAVAGAGAWTPTLAQGLRRRLHIAAIVQRVARRVSGRTDDELAEAAAGTPAKQQITAEVFEAAMRTALSAKVAALGRALANALLAESDIEVEKQRMLVAALAQLEAPHVQMLRIISGDHRESEHADKFVIGWTEELIGKEIKERAFLAPSIIAVLVAAGLAHEVSGLHGGAPGLQLMNLGQLVLDSLAAAAEDADALGES